MTKRRRKPHPSTLSVDTIEARRIVVKDECGRERIVMEHLEGEPGDSLIRMLDDTGRIRLELIVTDEGSFLTIPNRAGGSDAISLGNGMSGSGMTVNNPQGVPVVMLGAARDLNSPHPESLWVRDERRGRAWSPFSGEYDCPLEHADGQTSSTSEGSEAT
jgi:hypothetical protein